VPVDFLFQRIENAQPRVRSKARNWNRHNDFFRGAAAAGQRPVSILGDKETFLFPAEQPRTKGRLRWVPEKSK
jgi:hypothetical protein